MEYARSGLVRKLCAVGLSAATALAMTPVAAFGASLTGNTGAITVNGLNAGDTVTAYQILDRNYEQSTNNIVDTWFDDDGSTMTLDDFQKTASDGYDFTPNTAMQQAADKIASAITTGNERALTTETQKATGSTVSFGELPAGEWLILITGTDGVKKVYQNTIVNNAPEVGDGGAYEPKDVNVTIKSTSEEIHKGVGTEKADADSTKTSDGKYGIGDMVPFVISTTIPQYPADSTHAKFVIGDKPDAGLAIDESTVKVNVGGIPASADDGAFALAVKDGEMTITFDETYILQHPGQPVLVNYQAKITSDATVTVDKPTQNSATIEFNTNPYQDSKSKPGTHTDVVTYGLFFVKMGNDAVLPGATFEIKYAADVTDANGTVIHKAGDPVTDDKGEVLQSTSDEKGYVWFEDLAIGTYTLVETGVPSGYQKVADFDVTIDGTGTLDNPATSGVTEANYMQYQADTGVVDPKVGLLPTTGDAGTIGLTAMGVLLVAGSAFVISSRVRRPKDGQDKQ